MTPFVADLDFTLYVGDVTDVLAGLPDESVHCVVTSPPYWGLRDYSTEGQIGLEPTPDAYVQRMVEVFREVRRVLRRDGTCWLNLGDSYASGEIGRNDADRSLRDYRDDSRKLQAATQAPRADRRRGRLQGGTATVEISLRGNICAGVRPKNLVGIPWRVAFALQADGWYLRSDIIWAKPNPMPESVMDRPTKAHEYLFLLTKSARYFYDADAIREANVSPEQAEHNARYAKVYDAHTERVQSGQGIQPGNVNNLGIHARGGATVGRNARSVWEIATQPYPEAHFATFPEELPRRCIAAGCPQDGVVLDPFMGSGTTALVARKLGRRSIGIELSPEYAELAARRLSQLSLLAEESA